jgi:glycosyltransferase involved in cell wall biosynthesis
MRLLAITPTFFPVMGGAEWGVYEIYRRLALEHEVRILTPHPPASLERDFGMEEPLPDLSGLELVRFQDRVNLKNWPGHGLLKGLVPPYSISMLRAALREVKEFQPDVVNVFYALPSGLAASRIMKTKRAPVLLSLIGRDIPGPDIPRFWRFYTRMTARRVSKVLFISEYCRKALFGPGSTAGEVIPFGVDTERFRPGLDGSRIRERLGIPPNARVLFSLQRLDRRKRVDIVLQAMKAVLGKAEAYLVIGGKGPEVNGLRRLAADLEITSRVFFTGYIKEEELPLHFAMADIFVFHSTYETFGLVLVQALAAGKPVVSVRSTAIPELLEDGREGKLVAPLDPADLAGTILSLLGDDEALKRFSAAARQKAIERFSWEVIARRYEKIFSDLMK